jgi:WhiB family redox-sensing transcriptional regulator
MAWTDPAAAEALAALAVGVPLPWQDRALCAQADPEAWFPEKGGSTREAKRVCQACPVRAECREYALETDQRFGIWGGLSEQERRRARRGEVARIDEKTCTKCAQAKPLSEFHRRHGHRTGRYESRCKACRNASRRQERAA